MLAVGGIIFTSLCCPWSNEVLEAQEDLLGGQECSGGASSLEELYKPLLPELCAAHGIHGKAEGEKALCKDNWVVFAKSSHLAALLGVFPWDCSVQRAQLGHFSISFHLSSEFPCMEGVVTSG